MKDSKKHLKRPENEATGHPMIYSALCTDGMCQEQITSVAYRRRICNAPHNTQDVSNVAVLFGR